MGYAQLVIGPTGSSKSTYCSSLHQHCETMRRTIHIVNLDPVAEHFDYPVAAGQIELFTHVPILRNFVEHLKRKNFNVCAVFLLDSQFWFIQS
ncbi:hypothetical protein KSP40_PGU000756 [Platanthera guangdongensis]|uniref:GPN-loop GTPase 3 n=1 Tax=Platanthera guangdongensis TaxID=2320717 RepID=A0ABR2MBM8_9ASPA